MKSTFFTILTFLFVNHSFSQIVINEVMARPSGNQGLITFNGNTGKEYIELYNTSCSAVDVSGYLIGCRQDVFGTPTGGSFRIPAGTTIPANGHLVLGTNISSTNVGSVDIQLPTLVSNYCQNDPTRNFLLSNTDGWVALYNSNGTPIDAIYWATNASNLSQNTDFGLNPCIPSGTPASVTTLQSASQINTNLPGVLNYVGTNPSVDLTFSRIPDGGTWSTNINPSINDLTVGNCNNGICATSFNTSAIVAQPACGANNGSITINPSPSGTYTYTWTPNISSTNTANNLASGSYQITITANGGCTKDTVINLNSTNGPNSANVSTTNPGCGSSSNTGSVTINSVTGGTSPYQYNLGGTGFVSTNSFSNLAAGTYTLEIKDASGCTYIAPSVTINAGGNLLATVTNTPNSACSSCNYQGPSIMINEINIYPANGDGSIFGPGPNAVSEGEWIELYNPNWCDSIDISGYILGSYNSTASISPAQSDGMAFVIPNNTPKVPPLGFAIVRGANAPLPPSGVVNIEVNNNTNNACIDGGINTSRIWFQNTGGWFAFYNASGVPQDAISWGTPAVADLNGNPCIPTSNNLPGGFTTLSTYNTIGINANLGTVNQATTKVRIPDGGPWSTTANPSENFSYGSCNDPSNCLSNSGISTCNGTATVNITSGQAPYTFLWDDPAAQTAQTALNLCAGSYNVTVTDANSCTNTYTVTIIDDNFTIDANSFDPSCANNDGSITIITSKPGNYTYTWSSNANSTTNTATNLSGTTYIVAVSAGGCVRDTSITLIAPPTITNASFNNIPTTCGANNGVIYITNITGGTPNYQYSINGSAATSVDSFTNLGPNNYNISITDSKGCTYNLPSITIPGSNGITSVDKNIIPPTCGNSDGIITVINVNGGVTPYDFQLNTFVEPTGIFDSLSSGNYSLNIVDDNGCPYNETIALGSINFKDTITIPNILTANGDKINDIWFIEAGCVESFECKIVNRWGNLIYEYEDVNGFWNGKDLNNIDVTEGVYFYTLKIKYFGQDWEKHHGFIHLER